MKRRAASLEEELAGIEAPEISHPDLLVGIVKNKISGWVESVCDQFPTFVSIFKTLDRDALVMMLEKSEGEWLKVQITKAKLPGKLEAAEFRQTLSYWEAEVRKRVADQLWKIQRMSSEELTQYKEILKKYQSKYRVGDIWDGVQEAKDEFYASFGYDSEKIAKLKADAKMPADEG